MSAKKESKIFFISNRLQIQGHAIKSCLSQIALCKTFKERKQ
jgi:hypothetical protein